MSALKVPQPDVGALMVARRSAEAVTAVGLLVLMAAAVAVPLPWWLTGGISLKPATALAYVFAGTALRLSTIHPASRKLTAGLGAPALVIGLVALLQPLGLPASVIDRLWWSGPTDHPGISMLTAAALSLAAAGIITAQLPWRHALMAAQALGWSVLWVVLVAGAGHLYSLQSFYRLLNTSPMSPLSLLCLALLSVGLLFMASSLGVMVVLRAQTAAGATARRLLPVALGLPFVSSYLAQLGQQLGWLEPSIGLALTATASATGLVAVTLLNARSQARAAEVERGLLDDEHFWTQLGEQVREAKDRSELFRAVADHLAAYLKVERAGFYEIDPAAGTVFFHQYHTDPGLIPLEGQMSLSQFNPDVQHELATGKTVVVANVRVDPRTQHNYERVYRPLDVMAMAGAPIMAGKEWRFGVSVMSSQPRRWSEREISLLELAGQRTWLWLEYLRAQALLRDAAAEAADRRAEARYAELFNAVQDYAIITLDRGGNVLSWNPGAERIKGYSADDIVGRSFELFYPAPQRQRGRPGEILELAATHGRYEEEGQRVRKDGTLFWAHVLITALRGPDGTVNGFAKITRDVTERRATEHRLQSALKEREVLLQEVHHRVKNNLQVVTSLINMQLRQVRDEAARTALDQSRRRVSAIALIHEKLHQLKDFTQVPFDEYVRGLARAVFDAAGTSGDQVELKLSIEPLSLALEQAAPCGLIINELVSNAVKHAFAHGRRGAVTVGLARAVGGGAHLWVSDDGVGVPANFDVEATSSLGLRLVQTLARQLGGQLMVETMAGAGTTFRVSFNYVEPRTS